MGNSGNKFAVASQISMLDSNHDWSTSLCSGRVMSKHQAIGLVFKPILREVLFSSVLFSQKKQKKEWSNKIYDHGDTTIFGTSTTSGCFAMAPTSLASFFCFQTNRRLKEKSRSCLSLEPLYGVYEVNTPGWRNNGNPKNWLISWWKIEFLVEYMFFSLRFSEIDLEADLWHRTQFFLEVGCCSRLYYISDSAQGCMAHGTLENLRRYGNCLDCDDSWCQQWKQGPLLFRVCRGWNTTQLYYVILCYVMLCYVVIMISHYKDPYSMGVLCIQKIRSLKLEVLFVS